MIRTYILLLLFLLSFRSMAQTDSMVRAYQAASSPEERGKLAYEIMKKIPDSNPALYVAYAREGYASVHHLEVPVKAKLANSIGYYYQQHGEYDSAGYYFRIALATAKTLNSAKIINAVTANLGVLYSLKGEYPEALKYQLTSLNNFEQQKDTENARHVTIAIGNTYYNMHDNQRALSYFNRVYPALKDAKTQMAAGLFNSMGLVYGEMGDRKKEDALLQQSLSIKRPMGDSLGIANTLNNLGSSAVAKGDKIAAAKWFTEALNIAQAMGNKVLADGEKQNLAYLQVKNGNTASAIKQYKESLASAIASGDRRMQKFALESLFTIYDTIHDYASAYRYMTQYESLADTTRSTNYVREIADAETKYATQKALRERDRLQYESSLQAAARSRAVRERNFAVGLGATILAALLLVFLLAWRIRDIRSRSKEEQGYTRAIFEGEQAERIRIARDLHDSIGQMLSVVKMRLSTMQGLPADQLKESTGISMQLVDKTIDEVRTISHNLIPEELAFGIVRSLENLCNKISQAGEVDVALTISDEVRNREFNQQFSLSLYRIVQEVLGNMMKHSGASLINVNMAEAGSLIILQLTDNGKGFDTDAINASKGIGWKNIFARVNLLNGRLNVRSERISGTRIEITIPQ